MARAFFAMVSAAQEAIEEANASTEDEKTPRVLKDLAHFFRGPCRVLGYVPIVGALVPDQRSLLKLANEESEDEDDEEESKEEGNEESKEALWTHRRAWAVAVSRVWLR